MAGSGVSFYLCIFSGGGSSGRVSADGVPDDDRRIRCSGTICWVFGPRGHAPGHGISSLVWHDSFVIRDDVQVASRCGVRWSDVRWLRGGGMGVTSLGLGTVFPVYTSATGRVFLAHLVPERTMPQHERELGEKSVSSSDMRSKIEAARDDVRARGYAWLKGHFVEDIRGAAAPIFDSQGELVAVLAIAGSDKQRADGSDPSVEALVEAANGVLRQLCFPAHPPGQPAYQKPARG